MGFFYIPFNSRDIHTHTHTHTKQIHEIKCDCTLLYYNYNKYI